MGTLARRFHILWGTGKSAHPPVRAASRRGLSLMLVMIAISLSLVLTYAAISSQTRGLQVRQNVNKQELARRAAESGAVIALSQIESASWAGVASPLQGILESDSFGSTTYSVIFLTIDGQSTSAAYPAGQGVTDLGGGTSILSTSAAGLTNANAAAAATAMRQAFQLLVRVTGTWQSATTSSDKTTYVVEFGVELQPRVPGRTILSGDSASATDVAPNSGDYDTVQNYALFASTGTNGQPSLTIDPGHRIDGPVWLKHGVTVYAKPLWSSTPRNEFLSSVATRYSSTSGGVTTLKHPHPFGAKITNFDSIANSDANDLARLNVPTQQTSTAPVAPTVSFSAWTHYQMFQGGFSYDAEVISAASLQTDVLRPTLRNPLGIFYRDGNLDIGPNVVVQGTLVCTGRITFTDNDVNVASVNWRDADGANLLSNANLFPRLPAIVAREVLFNDSVRVSVDGAIVLTTTASGASSNYELMAATDVNVSGSNATATPIRQPFSQVQLPVGVSLTNVAANGTQAIWLADGNSGSWYPLVEVDSASRRLTVLGEANRPTGVDFRIRRRRARFTDLRGPLTASRLDLLVPNAWKLSTTVWSTQYTLWNLLRQVQATAGQPQTPFVDWVADPANYVGWGEPYQSYGLPLEPTFHLRPQSGVKYRDGLPLFRAYIPTAGVSSDFAGYRWRVLFWRHG